MQFKFNFNTSLLQGEKLSKSTPDLYRLVSFAKLC